MAPPKRTFFVMLVSVTGFLYFLYTAYTSSLDGPFDRFTSGKVFGNISYSTSSLREKKKVEQSTKIYSALGSISSRTNHSISSVKENVKNVTDDKKGTTYTVSEGNAGNATKSKPPLPPPPPTLPPSPSALQQKPPEEKQSVIQRIPPRVENVTIDYIVQGIATRSVYDSGFRVPNVELCPDFGSHLQVVIIITSAPNHQEARKAIRQTWGHYQLRSDVTIAFILGRSADGNESLILDENTLYGDIILANFVDSYNNLTLKTTSILEWVDNYCSRARFLLKTDDDMFINIPKLLDFVKKHWNDQRKIFGKLARRWKPIRKKSSKYYVSWQQYKHSMFPDFTTGPAYLLTSDVIHDLYVTALDMNYLKLEDVFLTGIVAQEKNVKRIHVNEFLNRRLSVTSCNVQKTISMHMVKPYEQYDLWKRLLDGRSRC